jgi:ankyrin repeat protein
LRAQDNFAIRWASYYGHAAVVDILVRFLTPDDLRAKNNSAIRLASDNGHAEVVKILVGFFNAK